MYKKPHLISSLFILAVSLAFVHGCAAQPAPKPDEAAAAKPVPAPKGPTEKVYSEDFDRVWDGMVEVVTERGLSEHPHGKMSTNKDFGKITTPVFRYFKISSAKPVQEKDYRDSYTILVASDAKTKDVAAKDKAEEAEAKMTEAKDKTGDEAKAAAEEGKKLAKEAAELAAVAKEAAAKPKSTKVQIQRKFEMYDNVKKAWTDTDPTDEKVGFTEAALLAALDGKLAAGAPAGAKTAGATLPNLNMTPPIFTEEEPKPAAEAPK